MADSSQALTLQWSFGFSSKVQNGVVNLSNGQQDAVAYIAAHTGIIYDRRAHTQRALQGHKNPITCIVATRDRKRVFTADAGPDNMLVVWDVATGAPLQTIAAPQPGGIVAMDLSSDGARLVTVSAAGGAVVGASAESLAGPQQLAMWDIHGTGTPAGGRLAEAPTAVAAVPAGDFQGSIVVNPANVNEAISTGRSRVFFWLHTGTKLKFYSPAVSSKDFKQAIGAFTTSHFVPGVPQAVTGTHDGDVVVWQSVGGAAGALTSPERRAVKVLRLHHAPITALAQQGRHLVTGGADGHVRFFDDKMRLVAWFEDMDAGPITSISFAAAPRRAFALLTGGGPAGDGPESDEPIRLDAPDFVVGTAGTKIVAVAADTFNDPLGGAGSSVGGVPVPRSGTLVLEGIPDAVAAAAAHPGKHEFATLSAAGVLQVWDGANGRLARQAKFDKQLGSALEYMEGGARLAVGFASGVLRVLVASTLAEVHHFKVGPSPITFLAHSSDGKLLATADGAMCVGLLSYGHGKAGDKWEFVGKYRTHDAAIVGLGFTAGDWGHAPRLLSLGEEGRVVEYDLPASSVAAGLKLKAVRTLSMALGALPTSLALEPSGGPTADREPQLLIADDGYKLRTYDASSASSRAVALGPTYGGPLTRLLQFRGPGQRTGRHYLVYATTERIAGLARLPVDGNPAATVGLIAHPGEISAMALSHDTRRLLTCGGGDGIANLWGVNVAALDAAADAVPPPMDGTTWHATLLEGGPGGAFASEIKDYFFFAQIKHQGEESMSARRMAGAVPLEDLGDIHRALGFYPSGAELADMKCELAARAADAGRPPPTHVTFPEFLQLFVSYRPVFGVTKEHIAEAFDVLGADPGTGQLSRVALVKALRSQGEAMSAAELESCLLALTGTAAVDEALESHMTAPEFAQAVLGFEDYGEEETDDVEAAFA